MKEVPFQIEQQNIFEMLTGNQFYENVDAYLREALLNAIDSCCMRQVLQYSWGAEFMERERDERDEKNLFVHHTKPLYVPKIRILLEEKTKTLTIDDNGMGMDIHDFYSYVIPIGKSYYRSEDFKIHRLDYEPLGNFGIGMQSYFKAATEIIIDSKKDKSVSTAWNVVDENRLKPVHFVWKKGWQHVELSPGGRLESGTRVTLVLKDEEMAMWTLEKLRRRILHFFGVMRVQIEISDGEKTVVLPEAPLRKEELLLSIKGVQVIPFEDDIIEGYVVLYTRQHEEIVRKPHLYQQGVLVASEGQLDDLKPEWLWNVSFQINLKGNFLNLKANHDGMVRDRKYGVLRMKIGNAIVNHFKKGLSVPVQYLKDGRDNMISDYPAEMNFVSQNVHVCVILKGQEVHLPISRIQTGFGGCKIRVAVMSKELYVFFQKKYPENVSDFLEKYDMILFEQNMHVFFQYMQNYIKDRRYVVSELPGMVYIHLEIAIPLYGFQCTKQEYIWRNIPCSRMDAMCFVTNDQYGSFELNFNPEHPLVKVLQSPHVSLNMMRVWTVIVENLKRRIMHNQTKWEKLVDFGGSIYAPWDSNRLASVQAIGCMEKGIIDAMNQYLEEHLSDEDLRGTGLREFRLTEQDFVSWWLA